MAKKHRKRYLMPAIASAAVAGLGQIIKGDGKKGLKLILWLYFGFPFIVILSMIINPFIFLIVTAVTVIVYPVIWAYNILDAFTCQIR